MKKVKGGPMLERATMVHGFAAASTALLLLYLVDRFGYSSTSALITLVLVALLGIAIVGIGTFGAASLAFVVFYGLDRQLGDRALAIWITTALAALACLTLEHGQIWRR